MGSLKFSTLPGRNTRVPYPPRQQPTKGGCLASRNEHPLDFSVSGSAGPSGMTRYLGFRTFLRACEPRRVFGMRLRVRDHQ
jgi:hypothetical protein